MAGNDPVRTLRLGGDRHSPAIRGPAQRAAFAQARRDWPDAEYFEVGVLSKWEAQPPAERSGTDRSVAAFYGHRIGLRTGKHYAGWRTQIFHAELLARATGPRGERWVTGQMMEDYLGQGPIRGLWIEPW